MQKATIILWACLFFVMGCSARISTYTSISDESRAFNAGQLKNGGLAMVPVGGLNPFYYDTIRKNAHEKLGQKLGPAYLSPSNTSQILNDKHLVQSFRNTMNTYLETGISEQDKFIELGEALGVRYLFRISLEGISSDKEVQGSDGEVQTYESRRSRLTAQVWDCGTGQIVWQGNARAEAKEGYLTYINQSGQEFVAKATRGLIDRLFDH